MLRFDPSDGPADPPASRPRTGLFTARPFRFESSGPARHEIPFAAASPLVADHALEFALFAPGPATSVRLRARQPLDLRQLEFFTPTVYREDPS